MGAKKQINKIEHGKIEGEELNHILSLGLEFSLPKQYEFPKYLGLNAQGNTSYYIGATWLKENDTSLVVTPKCLEINFIEILNQALELGISPSYFEKSYKIDIEAPQIECKTLDAFLTPLLVVHYLSVIQRLVQRGLKRSYIIQEENLKGKVKGHILQKKNFHKNIITGHYERVFCQYQDYSPNYPENQLLKRGLLAAEGLMKSLSLKSNQILLKIKEVLSYFQEVNSNITPSEVKSIRKDKLHGEYPTAIQLAKQILRRTDFAIYRDSNAKVYVPQFGIDMSRIFEFHVLSLLSKKYGKGNVLFQKHAGIMGRCDYLVPTEHLIIDAKYKPNYDLRIKNPTYRIDIQSDLREVAGYGRSKKIQDILNISSDEQADCLIIFPTDNYTKNEINLPKDSILTQATEIDGVSHFYTLGIDLPKIN